MTTFTLVLLTLNCVGKKSSSQGSFISIASILSGNQKSDSTFSSAGFFNSPETNNFLPNAKWGFVVMVTDSIGQTHFEVVSFDSHDAAATLAACILFGACG
jgi:hypothetical protein